MGETAMAEGVRAFKDGRPRSGNPHDPSSEDWMCWRDGYEQARAVAARTGSGNLVRGTMNAAASAAKPDPMLVRLVYVSTLSPGLTSDDVDALVAHSRAANVRRDITGLMAVDDGRVCHILEGPAVEVVELFAKIRTDKRHRDVVDLATTFIDRRHFGQWGMARRRMIDVVTLAFTI